MHLRNWPWIGDLFASIFVGTTLFAVYKVSDLGRLAPVLIGYLVPLAVYRFSCWWNGCTLEMKRALLTALVMGSIFWLAHRIGLSEQVEFAVGYAAPLSVSWWARRGERALARDSQKN